MGHAHLAERFGRQRRAGAATAVEDETLAARQRRDVARALRIGVEFEEAARCMHRSLDAAGLLPFDRLATSVLVAGDVAATIFGPHGNLAITVLALLVVLASLNGNIFVTPRVIFGLAREGLGPRVLAEVNAGGTPSEAMLSVGIVSMALAASGTFVQLLAIAIGLVLMLDSLAIAALFPLRARQPEAPFRVPLYPVVPAVLILVYLALLMGTAIQQPWLVVISAAVLLAAWGLSWLVI